jgi:hypothetical protein
MTVGNQEGDPRLVADPAVDATPVTPSGDTPLTGGICRALLVAVAGDLEVTTKSGNKVVLTVPAGLVPLQVSIVHAGNTTATGITALY